MYSKEYMEFIGWAKEKLKDKFTPLTGTQREFAQWCLDNEKTLMQIGDLDSIFSLVRRYLKET